jgi:hypothetical protein
MNGKKWDWRAGGLYGWVMGCGLDKSPPNHLQPAMAGNDNRVYNCTTVRYPLNKKTGWPAWDGVYAFPDPGAQSTGVGYDFGVNSPLQSAHSGGVLIVFGDGSVRFLTDSTPLATLAKLATRDDGQTVQLDN